MRLIPGLLLLASAAIAQPRESVQWAVAMSSRFTQLSDPVVGTYGFARLGEVVCAKDPGEGAELLRQALRRINLLSLDKFTWSGHALPVSSFTGLFKLAMGAAHKCDPALEEAVDLTAAYDRMNEERGLANRRLSEAKEALEKDPDRAAQLADGAITSSVPGVLDMGLLTKFLSELRDRAAELADDLFPDALSFVADAPAPDPSLLMQLGNYLFTSAQYASADDKEQNGSTIQVGSTQVADFGKVRNSANPDDVRDYIDATIRVVTAVNDPNYDPVVAYALASQMLAKALDVAPDLADPLRAALEQIGGQAGAAAGRFPAAGAADPNSGEGPRRRDRLIGSVLAEAGGGRFAEARLMAKGIDDIAVRSQVLKLIDFADGADAVRRKDIQQAIVMAGSLRPGIKRCLIDAGMQAAMTKEGALSQLQFAAKDTEVLPAEQRAFTWGAIASSLMRQDAESFVFALGQQAAALNDAYVNPRKGHFDPKSVRRVFNGRTDTSTDSALILFNRRGLVEVVDSGAGRHNFSLKVPGVNALRLPDVIRAAREIDPARIEAIALGLSSEAEKVNALVALAAARLQ